MNKDISTKPVSDTGKFGDLVTIPGAFQSAGLVEHTKILANMARSETDQMKLVTLASASILMAAAALEAVLSEAAYILKPALYKNNKFRADGAPGKYSKFAGQSSQDVIDVWNARIAIAHAEPDNKRTRHVGVNLNAQGADWAANIVVRISKEVWGDSVPKWFTDTTGIK